MDYLYGVSHDIVKPGSGATALKSFKSGYIISFSDVLRVYDQHLGLKLQIEHIKRHAECYITAIVVNNAEDNLYVGYSDGYLCKYQLPGGLLIKHRTIPFRVKGMIFHENEDVIILWGSYCELWFLDSRCLEKTQGFCVNDWPIAVPFVNGKILSITKSGQINEYMFEKADVKGAVIQRSINNESSLNLLLSDGIIKINDPVVDVKRVGEFSWVLAQRHGWILLRWQNDELIQEISSGSTSEIQEVIESDEVDCFGVLEENDKLVWVSKGQVVPIDPVWNKEARLIGIICQVDCLLALVEDNNMVFYSCDLNNSFEWTTTDLKEECTKQLAYITAVHHWNILVARKNHLWIHTIDSFIHDFQKPSDISLEPASTICIVENSILDTEKIIFGTADGRIVVVRKSSQDIGAIVCAFATQVTRIFRFPDSFENSSTLIIAVSLNNAVAVVDIEHGQLLHLIPGSNMNLKNISVAKDDHNKFCIEYYNNTRVWNLKSNCDVQGDLMSADKLYCKSLVASQGKRKSWGPLVPLASNLQRGASLVLMDLERLVKLASSQVALYSKDAQALLTCLSPLKGGLSSAHPSVRLSLAVREDQLTSVVTIASDSGTTYEEEAPLLIACIALETISDPRTDIHELIERYLSQYEFLEIDGFVKSALVFQNKFERIARLCLSSMAKRLVVKKQAAIDLANKWRPQLPSLCKDNINSEEGRQALLLIGALCIAENMLNLTNLNFVEKDVSESIQLCLIPDADNSMRELSISLLGSGWLVWQKWFNPIQILNSIIFILYNNGFTQKDSPKMTKILLICEECIKGISDSNMTLLISTLALQASDSNNPSDGRITALRLLSLLVSDNSGHHHALDKHYLPTVTSAAVKLLDPTDSVLREAAPIGGASLITEATRFLGTLVSKFPQDTSFHKSQQKLAITISREPENRSLDSPIIVLVYDLRSGGVSSTLGYRQSYDFISGLEFSINGKYLAAVIVDRKIAGKTAMHVSIVIWKLGYGITSIFQSLSISSSKESSPNVTNPSTPTEESTIQSGNIIYPKFIKEIQIDCKDSVKLQWTGDKIIEVLGDLDPQPTIINIEMN